MLMCNHDICSIFTTAAVVFKELLFNVSLGFSKEGEFLGFTEWNLVECFLGIAHSQSEQLGFI